MCKNRENSFNKIKQMQMRTTTTNKKMNNLTQTNLDSYNLISLINYYIDTYSLN